jgi:hypothetical protein
MFSVVEIDKTFTYEGEFTPYSPYVYESIVTVNAGLQVESIATYWTTTFGADGTYNTVATQIESMTLDSIFELTKQDSLVDCQSQQSSFYFDATLQVLYVHIAHTDNLLAHTVETGVLYGYCSDTVRYFRNQLYRPIVQSIPSLSDQADPLQYGIMAFGGGSIVFTNDVTSGVGLFDTDEKLYGNPVRIKRGKEGDDYDDLVLVFSGYVKDIETTTATMTLEVGDKRERLEVEYPTDVYDALDTYNTSTSAWEIDEFPLADGYGDVIQVPAHPIEEKASTIVYRWGSGVTSITQVYTYNEEVLTPISHTAFSTDGTFEVAIADVALQGADPKKGFKDVYVSGRMRDYDNPADIIADLNDRIANIEYNATNYNQTEWTSEKASLANVSLYMDEPKRLYEWIETLQAGSDYGFRYEDTDKITLRIDDKERTPITFADGTTYIRPVEIRNSDIPIKHNAQLYASSCIVKYAKNHRHGHYSQVTNTDYETDVLKEHRIKKIQTYESLLTNSTDADAKALLVMSDVSEVRPIVEIVIDSEKWLGSSGGDMPRIFDIVNIEASLLTHGSSVPTEWTFVLGDTLLLGDDDIVLGERYEVTRTEAYTDSRGKRIYAGEMKCQVIGVEPNLETDEIKLRLRKIG